MHKKVNLYRYHIIPIHILHAAGDGRAGGIVVLLLIGPAAVGVIVQIGVGVRLLGNDLVEVGIQRCLQIFLWPVAEK